ncbi:hypothetical protein REPUB_Repub08aG0213100 [Reevesia pubescens]
MDDVMKLIGGEFDIGKNEPEYEEYEGDEVNEPEQEDDHDSIKQQHHDGKEFMHTVLQDEDEVEFEPEDNNQGEEKEGGYDSGVEYMRDTVPRMEYFADEIEGNEHDNMLYNKTGRMVDVDYDEYCDKVVNSSDKKSNTLFLGNICREWTERMVKKIKSFSIKELKDLRLARDISNERINRGFAFLEFLSHSNAMIAYKRIQTRCCPWSWSAKICFAYPNVVLRDQIVAKVVTKLEHHCYLKFYMISHWFSENCVVRSRLKECYLMMSLHHGIMKMSWELVMKFGNIEKIELARYKPSANRRDSGFVTIYTHEAAVACVEAIDKAEFGNGHHKVKIKAILSQPFLKWKWKHQCCGNFHLVEEPCSGSGSAISMHETSELKPRIHSSSSGHKRENIVICPKANHKGLH